MKKTISIIISAIMLLSSMIPFSAFATAYNTSATAEPISLNQTVSTKFECGYLNNNSKNYIGYLNEKYFRFTAPETRYYEFNATGYESVQYAAGYSASIYISIKDSYGESVRTIYTNGTTGITKGAVQLKKGETYFINLYDSGISSIASYKDYTYGYATETIKLNIKNHTHTMYESYRGSYSIYYNCRFCDYNYSKPIECKHSHTRKTVIKNATYWTTGQYNLYCTDCGKTIRSNAKIAKKAVNLVSVKAGSKKATLNWKKASGAKAYQIQYSTASNMKNAKTLNVKGGNIVKKTVKKLKKGKKYYFRVRAKKGSNASSWSKIKAVKVK